MNATRPEQTAWLVRDPETRRGEVFAGATALDAARAAGGCPWLEGARTVDVFRSSDLLHTGTTDAPKQTFNVGTPR